MTHERTNAIAAIRALPVLLQQCVAGLTPAQLVARPLAHEWSIAQNEDRPPLKAYDQDAWAALPDGAAADITLSLQLLVALHARWADFFANCTDTDWHRVGIHSVSGEVSLSRQLLAYAAHGQEHLTQITAVKTALGC